MKILIVEDDSTIRQELSTFLTRYGYTVDSLDTFNHVAGDVNAIQPDLVLLDINLPVSDGFHICQEIRAHSNVPIIVVTSRDTEFDELMSMNLGADDFITKPYNTQILLARINAVLKRSALPAKAPVITHNGLTFDPVSGTITVGNQQEILTRNEISLLGVLLTHRGEIVTRETLMTTLWESDAFVDDNTLTVNVGRLRKKIEGLGLVSYLITRRGQGYMVAL